MNVDRRLENMRERLERSRPAQMVLTLASGEVVVTDPVGAITMLQKSEIGEVVGVTANRADYMGLAGYLDVLCHPAPNRDIRNFE